jgi:hypothetical protein
MSSYCSLTEESTLSFPEDGELQSLQFLDIHWQPWRVVGDFQGRIGHFPSQLWYATAFAVLGNEDPDRFHIACVQRRSVDFDLQTMYLLYVIYEGQRVDALLSLPPQHDAFLRSMLRIVGITVPGVQTKGKRKGE